MNNPHAPTPPSPPHANAADALDPAVDRRLLLTGLAGVAGVAALANLAKAGPLTPPGGPITSTPGPEPRIAVNAQNTPGSSTALFVISQPGSYYLTGNVQGVAGRFGIVINSSNVTLDLNGFTLQGVTGSLDGIAGGGLSNVTVCNGIVRGWGTAGITVFGNSTSTVVRNVTAADNASTGIFVNSGCQVTECLASGNATAGIVAANSCSIERCVCTGNGRGIDVNDSCAVTRCTATSNTAEGIRAAIGCTIAECIVRVSPIGLRLAPAGFSQGLNFVQRNSVINCGTNYLAENNVNFFTGNISALAGTNHWSVVAGNYIRAVVASGSAAFTGSTGGTSVAGTTNDPNMNFTIA